MTTNHIAERAGVNIASLYQYFPNKQAIVGELLRRHVERTRTAVVPVLERMRGGDLAAGVRALLEIVAAEHAIDPELHQIFTTIAPRLGFEAIDTDVDAMFADVSARWARSMRGALPEPELAMWIVRTAVHAVFHQAFLERPEVASSPRLVDELVRLVTRDLEPVPPAGPARRRPARAT
jgi:AcrR family transcriptional regulator